MSTLKFEKMIIPSANFGGESSVPLLTLRLGGDGVKKKTNFDEDDGLFIG